EPPTVPSWITQRRYLDLPAAAVRYLQRQLIGQCPPPSTLTRDQASSVLDGLCLGSWRAALGRHIREPIFAIADPDARQQSFRHPLGDLENTAPRRADLWDVYRSDSGIDDWSWRALTVQKEALLNRVDGDRLWFPLSLASPESIESSPHLKAPW